MKQTYTKSNKDFTKLEEFPMNRLEEEYDYSSDEDTIEKCKKQMLSEASQAIDYFKQRKPDQPELVENIAKKV